jgi:iron complex outermembrane receptor protein
MHMIYRTGLRRQLLLGGILIVTAASPAFARNNAADAPAAAPESPAVAADAPAADDQSQLSDIVVTATKRETSLQKTPIAVSVLSATNLQERHVQSLYDLADGAVPSLRVATFEARQSALTVGIRGIVPLDANQPAREQGVGIYIDGIYLARQHGLNAALFDLERVEVLKGPQGTLFGRNTEGGALSLVSKAPTGEFGLRATAGVSNYGGYNGDAHIDFPKIGDFAFKLDGVIQYQGATIKNPLAGQTGWNYYNRRGFRFATRWTPSSKFSADLATDVGYDANTPFYSQLLNVNPNGCVAGAQAAVPNCLLPGTNYTTLTGTVKAVPSIVTVGTGRATVADIGVVQEPSVDKTFGTSLTLKWKVADWIELRSITGYRQVSASQYDNSGGAHRVPVFNAGGLFSRYSLSDLTQHQWSQEIQAVGSLPRIEYAVGGLFFYEQAAETAATPSTNTWNATGTAYTINDPCVGSGGFGWQRGCRSFDRASRAEATSLAVFGQATYTPAFLNDTLHLTLGGRFTYDDKSGALYIVNNIPRPYTYVEKDSRFNPQVTLAWSPTPSVNIYAKYATGYRSGGASSRSVTYRAFKPEDIKSYEIGAKTEFFDHRVRLNLAAYIADRQNSQIDFSTTQFDAITSTTRNTIETVNAPGTTKIRGVEADLTVTPVRGLTLNASYAYTYTKVPLTANPSTGVLQQVFIVFTPRNAASGSLDYNYPIGDKSLKLHLDANYSQSTQAFDTYATHNDASFLVNGRLTLADISLGSSNGKLAISVWARNVFNEAHIYRRDPSNSLPGFSTSTSGSVNNVLGDYGNYNAPRTFGIEGTIKL